MTEQLPATGLGLALASLAGVLFGGAVRLARRRPRQDLAPGRPTWRALGGVALIGALAGSALAAAGLAGAGVLDGAPLAPPWDLLVGHEAVAAACVAAALLLVRGDPGSGPWWLLGPCVAAAMPWVTSLLAPDAAGLAPLRLGLVAAVAASALLSPGRRARRMALARQEAFRAAGDGIIVLDAQGHILEARGSGAEALLASSATAVGGGRRLAGVIEVRLSDPSLRRLRVKAGAGRFLEVWKSDERPQTAPGDFRALLVRDISKQYRDERNLIRLAHYDSLTGLANRRLFLEHLKRDLEEASGAGAVAALFYVDLDQFKDVNDSLGHGAGDALLEEVAARLIGLMRPSDVSVSEGPTDVNVSVARLSGDEFAIIVSRVTDEEAARAFARRVLRLVEEPMQIAERSLKISASVGIALFPKDGADVEGLIRSADSALYAAKKRGRGRLAFYEPQIDAGNDQAGRISQALRLAIERSELSLHYQPKVEVSSGTAVGLEALLRWKSAELGEVRPKDFVPVAEEHGLISEIGAWCLNETCRQIRSWREEGRVPVAVSVNVSSAQFRESDLQMVVSEALKSHEVGPELLEIELTESLLLDEGEDTALCLRDLRAMGIRIALDDFGTGYSALTYLNRFPLDVLKMDRGFLREIHTDDSAAQVASAVVSMAHGLGLVVVAEGVDSQEQLPILREMQCDQIQGFLYSPALPADEALRFLAQEGEARPAVPFAEILPGRAAATPAKRDTLATEPAFKHAVGAPAAQPALAYGSAPPPAEARKTRSPTLMLVDDGSGSLQVLAGRLVRLGNIGIDLHYAAAPDEARLLMQQENLAVRAFVAPPTIDPEQIGAIRQGLVRESGREAPLVVMGEEPDARVRAGLRGCGVSTVLWSPFDDTELAFVLKTALTAPQDQSRRLEIRVPVDVTARLRAGHRREVVVLSSLSRRGAFLELSDPLPVGTRFQLEFELAGDQFRFFASVVHTEHEDSRCPFPNSGNGVLFYGADRAVELRLGKAIEESAARYMP